MKTLVIEIDLAIFDYKEPLTIQSNSLPIFTYFYIYGLQMFD